MEKTLQEVENLWKKKEQPILTDYLQNHELAQKFANGEIIIEHSTKEEDLWMICNLQYKFNLSHENMYTLYGGRPIPYDKKFFYVMGEVLLKGRNHLIWDLPASIKQSKPIVHIYELYTKYPDNNE